MNAAQRAVRAVILRNPQLAAKLQTATGHAVRPGDASQVDRPPYVLLWRITDRPVHTLNGRESIRIARVQVDSYAATKSEAAAIAQAIGDAVALFQRGNADGVWLAEITEDDTRDRDERNREGADLPLRVVQADYLLTYRDNTPPTL
ncbi:tail completion protein gp17 [Allorhodopirellula heiligendammensis]|uniref:DUF3168 domain-containing protein n=1 Tax=Allorhodopirellula heiligendammensis TaxID=2714739 RepID=A0A5C6C690_9BACT|nr:DUF3168 domain-containing protein [Allorhodopirellula heiligendammensis]TWU19562.1 hypothetical protein Poly21_17360 [Allorhodopirellula heiligendammensis]